MVSTANYYEVLAALDTELDVKEQTRSLPWTFHSQEQQRALLDTTHFLDHARSREELAAHGGHMHRDITALVRKFFAHPRGSLCSKPEETEAVASLLHVMYTHGSLLGWEKTLHVHRKLMAPLVQMLLNAGLVELDHTSQKRYDGSVRDAYPGARPSRLGYDLMHELEAARTKKAQEAARAQEEAQSLGVALRVGALWGDLDDE